VNLNKAELIGNFAADPEAKAMASSKAVARFTVATGRDWNDREERRQEVEYHAVAAHGKLGDIVLQYLKKGDRVYLSGRLKTSRGGSKNSLTMIFADNLIMLGGAKPTEKVNDDVVEEEIEVEGEGV
jgi:single-strand DNA-binding protein